MQENKQEKSPIKQRILLFIDKKGISQYEFYKRTGITRCILGQNNGISEENLTRFLDYFPSVSLDWLLTGKGPMLKEEKEDIQILHHPKVPEKIVEQQSINLYDINAAANLKTLFDNKDQNILGEISIPDIPKCDGAVYVRGDSMYPILKSGDIIAYKEIFNFQNLIYGEMYLISFDMEGDFFLTVKYINHSDKDGYIKLVSYNTHHDPMDIPISSINALALVKFSIRKNTII